MKLVWSPETASKAYIDTAKYCEVNQESSVAELISAMAAGWNAKLVLETWSRGGILATSIGLAIASRHTDGRHVCIVPDELSRSEYEEARDFARVLRVAKLSSRGAVLVCKNASSRKGSSFGWRGVVDGGSRRLVRSVFLPVGKGVDIAHVATSGGNSSNSGKGKSRWIKHVDRQSGEEYVIRK
ncbi:hypothetical protein OIU84_022350 [Salix udensis]|uniref:Uncharacterized protein n=1 Tax=Salix udensis TaxID=889485 RepID=A0AAD6KNK4_9ROSI|nr:hypothetical protein OIU84_022350 [Salix udensis]